jgi:hypothetical protein
MIHTRVCMCACAHASTHVCVRVHVYACACMHGHVACGTVKLSICSSYLSVYSGHRGVINSDILGHDTKLPSRWLPVFGWNMQPPSSG